MRTLIKIGVWNPIYLVLSETFLPFLRLLFSDGRQSWYWTSSWNREIDINDIIWHSIIIIYWSKWHYDTREPDRMRTGCIIFSCREGKGSYKVQVHILRGYYSKDGNSHIRRSLFLLEGGCFHEAQIMASDKLMIYLDMRQTEIEADIIIVGVMSYRCWIFLSVL